MTRLMRTRWLVATLLLGVVLASVGYQVPAQENEVTDATAVEEPHSATSADSINAVINAMFEKVKPAFEYSCYDCHSNRPDYPWYHSVPGIKQLIDSDVEEACDEVDFSKGFPFVTDKSQAKILAEIRKEIDEGEMPLFLYRTMHWGRLIEDERQDSVFAFIDSALVLLGGSPNGDDEHE